MEQKDIFDILKKPNIAKCLDEMGQLHAYTKHYLLVSEELSETGVAFLQPLKEHRDAYDHLMRIFAIAIRGDTHIDSEKYIEDNVKKAFGHEYRAFFDTADWFTFICRKYIREELSYKGKRKKYEAIYMDFDEVKEFINDVPIKIAQYREEKDVSMGEPLINGVIEYKEIMERLLEIYKRVRNL